MQTDLFQEVKKVINGATFSDCRKYRYALWRIWDENKPFIMFIGLNPSTANENDNDPTIRRVIGFAKDWGYGGIYMMNLFAIVSSNPEVLKTSSDPIGENDKWLLEIKEKCKDVLFAWGNFDVNGRDKTVSDIFPKAVCLGFNKNGSPKHPLYISAKQSQINYK